MSGIISAPVPPRKSASVGDHLIIVSLVLAALVGWPIWSICIGLATARNKDASVLMVLGWCLSGLVALAGLFVFCTWNLFAFSSPPLYLLTPYAAGMLGAAVFTFLNFIIFGNPEL